MSTPEEKPVASTGEFKIRKRTRKTKATTIKRDIDDEVENEEVSIPELRKQTVCHPKSFIHTIHIYEYFYFFSNSSSSVNNIDSYILGQAQI